MKTTLWTDIPFKDPRKYNARYKVPKMSCRSCTVSLHPRAPEVRHTSMRHTWGWCAACKHARHESVCSPQADVHVWRFPGLAAWGNYLLSPMLQRMQPMMRPHTTLKRKRVPLYGTLRQYWVKSRLTSWTNCTCSCIMPTLASPAYLLCAALLQAISP